MTQSEAHKAALKFAERGIPVFPCSPAKKNPLTESGLKAATTDPRQIRIWWETWPKAMIGMPCGEASGVFVVDLDPRDHPVGDMLAALDEWCGGLPKGPIAETQSGGLHIWFHYPAGMLDETVKLGNKANLFKRVGEFEGVEAAPEAIATHVDVRSEGGYVIVPPSVMGTGNKYTWHTRPSTKGDKFTAPHAPSKLLDLIIGRGSFSPENRGRPKAAPAAAPENSREGKGSIETAVEEEVRKYALSALDKECNELAREGSGGRNQALNNAALKLGGLVSAGALSEAVLIAALEEAASKNGLVADDGLHSVQATIESGLTAGKKTPRDLDDIRQNHRERLTRGQQRTARRARGPAQPGPNPLSEKPPASSSRTPAPPPSGEGWPKPSQFVPPDGFAEGSHSGPMPEEGGAHANFGVPIDDIEWGSSLPMNDTGNGQRFLRYFGANLLHVREVGWYGWHHTHWERLGGDEYATRCAQRTGALINVEANVLELWPDEQAELDRAVALKKIDPDDLDDDQKAALARAKMVKKRLSERRAQRRKFSISSGNSTKIKGMITQALPHRTVCPDDMDAAPMDINFKNGTLSAAQVEDEDSPDPDVIRSRAAFSFREHQRDDHITKLMPAIYDPEATCPKWLEMLEMFQPNPAMREFLQVYCGYAMTAKTDEQVLIFNYGTGANGKSTFTEAIRRLFGQYATTLNPESVAGDGQRRGDQATPDIADLPAARLVIVSELPKNVPIKENLIKALTGGEPMKARHLQQGFFEFTPEFKAIMSGNSMPNILGSDFGIWRRLLIVPWRVTMEQTNTKKRKMADVLAEFDAERSGILNWLLKGLEIYLTSGLQVPPEVEQLTAEHRQDVDRVGNFIRTQLVLLNREECDREANQKGGEVPGIQASYLYECFCAWCDENGYKVLSQTAFGKEMPQHDIKREDKRIRRYLYIAHHPEAIKPVLSKEDAYPP